MKSRDLIDRRTSIQPRYWKTRGEVCVRQVLNNHINSNIHIFMTNTSWMNRKAHLTTAVDKILLWVNYLVLTIHPYIRPKHEALPDKVVTVWLSFLLWNSIPGCAAFKEGALSLTVSLHKTEQADFSLYDISKSVLINSLLLLFSLLVKNRNIQLITKAKSDIKLLQIK